MTSEAGEGAAVEPPADAVEGHTEPAFDFDHHRHQAEEDYRRVRGTYEDCAETVRTLLARALSAEHIKVHSIEARAKTVESFGLKAARPDAASAQRPRYPHPLVDIEDLAAARVITFFLEDVHEVERVIRDQFQVLHSVNRSAYLRGNGGRLGYESMHYMVQLHPERLRWPEYAPFLGFRVEVQVRTILQHAWAEIEHDVQYKSVEALPAEIGRRFLALAGMIEIGDREFQAIADQHKKLRADAQRLMREGRLDQVEITPESLRDYLNDRLGPDGRMSDFSYSFTAGNLKRQGFKTLAQVEECIAGYDDDAVSRALYGSRQGQITRFEGLISAGMGEQYLKRPPYGLDPSGEPYDFIVKWVERVESSLAAAGIPMKSYLPDAEVEPEDAPRGFYTK